AIPLPDDSVDVVISNCVINLSTDKPAVFAQMHRVLRPGGRVGITDVTITPDGLPDELTTLAAWVACIADAKPLDDYAALLADAGLSTVHTEPHDDALAGMIDQIDARIRLLRMTSAGQLAASGVDVDAVLRYCAAAKRAVDDGIIGYALLVAENPTPKLV
ncbi:MAG: methyltransferase domain-containing protein, partial [Thermocrispum sp.]